jgi:5-methylthioadenosine/S-adenosylhomocysteine deaminase
MIEPIDLLLIHANLITQNTQRVVIEDGALAIKDGMIVALGTSADLLPLFQPHKVLDAGGKWAIPGFINTHNHLFQVVMRGLGKDVPFMDWMVASISKLMPFLDEESIYLAALIGCMEAVRTGTTTMLDFMYANIHPMLSDVIIQAFDDLGIRGVLGRGFTDVEIFPFSNIHSHTWEPIDRILADVDRLLSRYQGHRRIKIMLAPSVVWNITREGLAATAEYARLHDLPVTMHLLETGDDDLYCQQMYGQRTLPFLEKIGFLGPQFLGVHAIHLLPEDFDLIRQYNVKISYNPVSNMILGNGVCPIPELHKSSIQIGLGTDGAASNDSQNLLETMKIAALLQKNSTKDTAVISAQAVFSMATDLGAQAIGQDKMIGSLEIGKCADIVLVDLNKVNTMPSYDPIASLIYSGSERNIYAVMVDGQLIYQDSHFTTVDEESILQRMKRKAQELYLQSGHADAN